METITFYSYKGGVGRTLLLANAARYFALLGKRVIAIDFDFEAPGLHYKLDPGNHTGERAHATPGKGVVDYLLAALDPGREGPVPLQDHLMTVPVPPATASPHGSIKLMPAGSAPSADYWTKLTKLLHQDPITGGEARMLTALIDLKARLETEEQADLLLIDSRTGVTEMGGLATTVLADKVVCLFLNNEESLNGTRAVIQSLPRAGRLPGDAPIRVLPVLSRTSPEQDSRRNDEELLKRLSESEGDAPSLDMSELFILHSDPGLEIEERLQVGAPPKDRASHLYRDYLHLAESLADAPPEDRERATARRAAVHGLVEWLTDSADSFDVADIDEGVQFRSSYADVVAYSGSDRTQPLLVAVYLEDGLKDSSAWRWWNDNTRFRCVILFGRGTSAWPPMRTFTRGSRSALQEVGYEAGWAVKRPSSFFGLDDPGDRSLESMLGAVQTGQAAFIEPLVERWRDSVMFGVDGGMPFRPDVARTIIDGLADVHDMQMAYDVLYATDPEYRRTQGHVQSRAGMPSRSRIVSG